MSGYDVIRSNKGQKECCRDHIRHTQFHSAEVQFGTRTSWVTTKVKKENKSTSSAVTRRRDISYYLTDFGVGDYDR